MPPNPEPPADLGLTAPGIGSHPRPDRGVEAPQGCGVRATTGVIDGGTGAPTTTAAATNTTAAPLEQLRPLVRPAIAVALIVVAYHYSLRTLVESLTLSTPVAQLGLAPFIAFGLVLLAKQQRDEPEIHDRQLDWIVGIPLVASAVLANLVLPVRLSTMFWYWRVDLLTMPIFIAGVVTLLFGVRTLWRIRAAILFLLLAWPYPYTELISRFLDTFTDITIWGIRTLTQAFPVADALPGSDNSLFRINADQPFDVQIASACSGANGLVGFTLVGVAFLLSVKGPRAAKISWLVAGAFLTWLTNLVRIMAVLGAGRAWGESFAIDGLHPYIGLVIFSLTVLFMVSLLPKFGLRVELGDGPGRGKGGTALARPRAHRPNWKSAGAVTLACTAVIGVLNADLSSADLVGTSLGSPRLAAFTERQSAPIGWRVQQEAVYEWPKQFFGKSSSWTRYSFLEQDDIGELYANSPVITDIIETSNRRSLAAYGVEQCYEFHDYDINAQQSVDLGGGIIGGILTWQDPDRDTTTTTLYWHWPVKTEDGTRFERVTLYMTDHTLLDVRYPELDASVSEKVKLGITDVIEGDAQGEELSERLIATRSFLVAFARQFIETRAPAEE